MRGRKGHELCSCSSSPLSLPIRLPKARSQRGNTMTQTDSEPKVVQFVPARKPANAPKDQPPYPTRAVVNSPLTRAFLERRKDITEVRLQKLLFLLSGWHLDITGCPCTDRDFEVYKYGPEVISLYREFDQF